MIPLIVLPSLSCCRISLTCFRWRRHVGWEFFSSGGWQKTAEKASFAFHRNSSAVHVGWISTLDPYYPPLFLATFHSKFMLKSWPLRSWNWFFSMNTYITKRLHWNLPPSTNKKHLAPFWWQVFFLKNTQPFLMAHPFGWWQVFFFKGIFDLSFFWNPKNATHSSPGLCTTPISRVTFLGCAGCFSNDYIKDATMGPAGLE